MRGVRFTHNPDILSFDQQGFAIAQQAMGNIILQIEGGFDVGLRPPWMVRVIVNDNAERRDAQAFPDRKLPMYRKRSAWEAGRGDRRP